MSINISARKVKLRVGDEDWSKALLEVSNWQSTSLDQSGLIRTTATLTLISTDGLPGSLDDRKNTSTWKIGNEIRIDVTNSSGVLRRHPVGTLRLLSAEYTPDDKRLIVNAGCLITLLNYRQPTNYTTANIVPGTPRPRLSIIGDLLSAAGITDVYCPYTLPCPIAYPIRIQSSYLQAVGAMLYSIGYVGWIDKSERFCISPVQLSGDAAMTLQIGGDTGDETYYRRLSNPEAPREAIRVSGVCPIVQIPEFPKSTNSTRYGAASAVDPSLGSDRIIMNYTEEEETWDAENKAYARTTKTYSPAGLSLPDASDKTGLIQSEQVYEERHYELTTDGKLIKVDSTAYKVLGAVLAEYVKSQEGRTRITGQEALFFAEKTETIHAYDSKSVPLSVTTTKYESLGALLAGTNFDWDILTGLPTELKSSEVTVESWKEKRKGEWVHTVEAYKTQARLKPNIFTDDQDLNSRLALITDDSSSLREESNSGQTVPPAPERHVPKATFEDKQIIGEVTFSQVGSNPYKERSRTYSIDYLEAAEDETKMFGALAQCHAIGKIEGKLLYGRFKGQEIGIDLKDKLFDWEPLMRVNCVEPDGTTRAFCLDDAHWFLGASKALCNFGAIWIGNRASDSDTISSPYEVKENTATKVSWNTMTRQEWNAITEQQWKTID